MRPTSRICSYHMSNRAVTGKIEIPVTGLLLTGTLLAIVLFTGCSSSGLLEPDDAAPPEPLDVSNIPNAVPRPEPLSRYGNPTSYVVNGKRYYTMPSSKSYKERGLASWYGTKFQGKRTSSGEPYNFYAMTAAHRSLPLPTYVEVENLQNGRSVIVKVNDRGPFHQNRIIDLSYTAAVKLGILGYGTGLVEVRAIDTSEPEPAHTPGFGQEPEAPRPVAQEKPRPVAQEKPRPVAQEKPRPVAQEKPRLYLQVGAYHERRYAEQLRADLEAHKLGEVRIVELTGEPTFYKVHVGPLQDTAEANRINRKLKTLGINDGYSLLQ
jgi:rare lipoprotein A